MALTLDGEGEKLFGNRHVHESIIQNNEVDGNIKLGNLIPIYANTEPTLTDAGELALWILDGEVYDVYNSIVDPAKWTYGSTGDAGIFGNQESTTYIQIKYTGVPTVGAPAENWTAALTTDAVDPAACSNIKFKAWMNQPGFSGNFSSYMDLYILGKLVKHMTTSNETDDSIWTCVKGSDGKWDIYDDGALVFSDWVATENQVRFYTRGDWSGAGEGSFDMGSGDRDMCRFYEIKLDAQTFLVAKESASKQKKVELV